MSRRKIINGKVYDVDTAKPVGLKGRTCYCRRIIKYENNSSSTSYIRLYRKKTGEYFTAKYSSNWPIDSFPYEITPRTEEWANGFYNKVNQYGVGCDWVYDVKTKKNTWIELGRSLPVEQIEEKEDGKLPIVEQPKDKTEQKFYVQCSYSTSRTTSKYSTLWMTYVCGPEYLRKKVRIDHSCFGNIRCNIMDEWGFLRKNVGLKLDNRGPMTFKELKDYIEATYHFNSEGWGDAMRSYVWYWEHSWEKTEDGRYRFDVIEDNYKSFKGSDYCIITSDPMDDKRKENKAWKVDVEKIGEDKAILHDNGKEFLRYIRKQEIECSIYSPEHNNEIKIRESVFCPDNWDIKEEFEKVLCEYEDRYGEISNPEEIDLERLSSIADNRREMMRHLFY